MRWDLEDVYKSDDWDLPAPTDDELPAWEQDALANPLAKEHGTVVLWSGLEEPLLSSDDVRARERFLARLIDDVSDHLRMVVHKFMEGSITGRKKLHIHVCGTAKTTFRRRPDDLRPGQSGEPHFHALQPDDAWRCCRGCRALRAFVISGNLDLPNGRARYDLPPDQLERYVAGFIVEISSA